MKGRIYDAPLTLFVLAVMIGVILLPFALAAFRSGGPFAPPIEKPKDEKACIEDAATMRESHMNMLMTWRDDVVRNGDRKYHSQSGKTYDKSLTKTCLRCHTDEQKFCTACHESMGVSYNCFACHEAKQRE